ncbi:hypothetical protein HaLaN_16475, partial [Haematococcus lacustris]
MAHLSDSLPQVTSLVSYHAPTWHAALASASRPPARLLSHRLSLQQLAHLSAALAASRHPVPLAFASLLAHAAARK